jgi:sugar phosphate isomerase/epimerase
MTNEPTRRAAVVTGLALLRLAAAPAQRNLKVAIFSKHLQFLQGAELAHAVAEMGFNGIDVTVRAGGHVDPARVADELPPLVSLIRQHGLEVPMVTTDIVDATSPHARNVLKTLNSLGIRYYRWGGFKYEADQPFSRQLEGFRRRSAQLAAVNAEYKVCAIYHTHSGVGLVGAPVWDIFQILNGLDREAVAINYDVGHATVEGGLGGWIDSFRLAEPYIRGVAFKDFFWQKDGRKGWEPAWVPLGQGMVRFPTFCSMLAQTSFEGPVQLHFEYPLGGADAGHRDISIAREQVFSAMRRDLHQLRGYLDASGLSHG